MSSLALCPLDPLDFQFCSSDVLVLPTQEIINYCESRFRQALSVLGTVQDNPQLQIWMEERLSAEMVLSNLCPVTWISLLILSGICQIPHWCGSSGSAAGHYPNSDQDHWALLHGSISSITSLRGFHHCP